MGSEHLSERSNWQMGASVTGKGGEDDFAAAIAPSLPSPYEVVKRPKKLQVYSGGRGIVLDCKIINHETGKSVLIENKTGNNGGNAHERVYKFLAPALKQKVRSLNPSLIEAPFYLIFSGETFQGQKYQDELSLLLKEENYDIIQSGYENIESVAKNIMELLD